MVIKVQEVERYNNSDTLICKGKLVLTKSNHKLAAGLLAQSKSIPTKFTILNQATVDAFKDEPECGWQIIFPIIISETEEVDRYSQMVLFKNSEILNLSEYTDTTIGFRDQCKILLAFPYQFSPEHIKAIIDGKLKSGDEVCVECEVEDKVRVALLGEQEAEYKIKLNQQARIELFPVKQEQNWNDVFQHYGKPFTSGRHLWDWLSENYHPPIKKN